MLDRAKVLQELQALSHTLSLDVSSELVLAEQIWNSITKDGSFASKAAVVEGALWPIPTWFGSLDECIPVQSTCSAYEVIAVDGSQIYPDKHQGTSCYLINIGGIHIRYGSPENPLSFYSQPHVFLPNTSENTQELAITHSTDFVNCLRHEYEFKAAVTLSHTIRAHIPNVILLDGSLIFWHLENKETDLKDRFLGQYLFSLHALFLTKTAVASYISLPKSKELVTLLRLALCNFDMSNTSAFTCIERLVDTHIINLFLPVGNRSTVFINNSKIALQYPAHLKPCFFYLNTGYEVARIEVPYWIGQQKDMVDSIATLILDQVEKGLGYPVTLAEAHEQAVVKGPDRDFFYHMIQKCLFEQTSHLVYSKKSIKKRAIGI